MKKTKKSGEAQASRDGIKLQIDSEVTRCIRQHARSSMKTEVCGVLIGEERDGLVDVQASIEASSAAQAGTHVTFTQDAWEEIYRVKDQSWPDHRIVGWYHSHPGFGVFLSEHDTFIHRNFFSSPNQVAWVYDPHTDEEGCFGWRNGEIERIASLSIVDLNGDGEERTRKEPLHPNPEEEDFPGESVSRTPSAARRSSPARWISMLVTTVSYVSVAVVGFFVCFFLFPSVVGVVVDPRTMEPFIIDGKPVMFGKSELVQMMHVPSSAFAPESAPPAPQEPVPQTSPQPNAAPAPSKPGGSK